mgnify:FL=1
MGIRPTGQTPGLKNAEITFIRMSQTLLGGVHFKRSQLIANIMPAPLQLLSNIAIPFRPSRLFLISLLLGLTAVRVAAGSSPSPITLVLSSDASAVERFAVGELQEGLQSVYPAERFVTTADFPPTGRAIVLVNKAEASGRFARFLDSSRLAKPESFVITHRSMEGREIGVIAGADARGVSYGIYALLEKLGDGFYLSFNTTSPLRSGPLAFDRWDLADEPLFADRIALNWQNFLSSASTWEFADWTKYIDAVLRLRFNDLMVHAYGNNPMFTFTFNGVTKPVGYISTTARGRDWGTQHVNDVRRMIGGEIFADPVFGASVAKGDPAQRVEAATALMNQVFAHARARGLGVTFALDIDSVSANPQEIIHTLPASARFSAGNYELANPDTPEGFAYYQAQLDQLLARYPDITRFVAWFRSPESNTPWRRLKRAELPAAWQREFTGPDEDVSAFALAKVVGAFRRALQATGRHDVAFAAGSWAFPFLEASDRYLPPEIPLIALDWWVSFDTARAQRDLHRVHSGRKIVPIIWAHHDDRTYIGRSYTPFVDLATKLQHAGAAGFGINHWTTRPLDLYFKSTVAQTWKATMDQPLDVTCDDMAARIFGEPARTSGGSYLFSWVTEAPMFGRETSAHFVNYPLPDPELHAKLGRERLTLLAKIDPTTLTPAGAAQLRYFQNYEKFMRSFFASQTAEEQAAEALKRNDYPAARAAISRARPEAVIRDYVAAARTGQITRGEEALVVSLNLRWLPDVLSLRQAVGLEPVRYRFGEILQEPLAQGAYPNTYYFDAEHRLWKVIDAASRSAVLKLGGISGDKLAPGRYRIDGLGVVESHDGTVEIPAGTMLDEIVITPEQP